MRRYHITQNATTTVGGRILAATSLITISGHRMAQEGDTIYCPACKSEGRVVCVGPRVPERAPKPVALSDDLCKCRCPILPKLVAVQTLRSQVVESSPASDPENWHVPGQGAEAVFDESFRAIDPRNGEPLVGASYKIVHPGGAELTGVTDAQGYTARVYTATAEQLSVYWLESDPVPQRAHDDNALEDDPC
jgi:uncharacterized Zn-binding protein involved in type VI secretion